MRNSFPPPRTPILGFVDMGWYFFLNSQQLSFYQLSRSINSYRICKQNFRFGWDTWKSQPPRMFLWFWTKNIQGLRMKWYWKWRRSIIRKKFIYFFCFFSLENKDRKLKEYKMGGLGSGAPQKKIGDFISVFDDFLWKNIH